MNKKLLLPHQSMFIQAPYLFPEKRFHFLVAGYGSGKTSALASLWGYVCQKLQGKKDKEGHPPMMILSGVNLGHLMKTTVAYILADLDNSKTPYTLDKKNNRLTVGNVVTVLVSNTDPNALVGFSAYCALADEIDDSSGNEEIPYEMVRALNERTRQLIPGERKPFLSFASTSQGQSALYRVYTNFKKAGTAFTLIKGRTRDNFYLDPEYYQSLEKIYSPRERLVFLDGEFLAIKAGRVFPDFDWEYNFVNEPMDQQVREDETIFVGCDVNSGYNRAQAAILRNGVIYSIKYYDFPDLRTIPQVLRYDFPRNQIYFLPDASNNKDVLSFVKELRKHNIYWITRAKNPPVEDTVFLVNKLLYTRRLVFTQASQEAAEACAGFMRDKYNAVPPGKTPNDLAHANDSLRWISLFVTRTQHSMSDILRATILRKFQQEENNITKAVEELPGGYASISPGAL